MEQMTLFDNEIRNISVPLASRVRPKNLDQFVGQQHLIGQGKILRRMIETDQVTSMIFWGPPGVGKTTLAGIIAEKTKANFINFSAVTSGIKEIKEVMQQAENSRRIGMKTILFVDEIHRFNKAQQDAFLPYVERGSITLIGATTKAGSLTTPLRDRFGIIHKLELYSPEDLQVIVKRSARILEVEIDDESAMEIARRSRGTPRIANRLLKRVRDYAAVLGDGEITLKIAKHALNQLEIDELGLDEVDRRMLEVMITQYQGRPVGIETIAVSLGEEIDTIEDVYEPYLIQIGFISRTPRGRIVMPPAYQHLGYPYLG